MNKFLIFSSILILATCQVCTTNINSQGVSSFDYSASGATASSYSATDGVTLTFSSAVANTPIEITLSNWGKDDDTVMRAAFTSGDSFTAESFQLSSSQSGVVVRS